MGDSESTVESESNGWSIPVQLKKSEVLPEVLFGLPSNDNSSQMDVNAKTYMVSTAEYVPAVSRILNVPTLILKASPPIGC